MTDNCTNITCEIEKLQTRQSKTLKVVLGINVGMFLVEFLAGLIAGSTALLADSLDMLGDALVYGFSLYVVSRNDTWKAVSALIKSGVIALFGLFVLGQVAHKFLNPMTPHFETIGLIGLLALAANVVCLSLLIHHRAEDVNMRSVWLCSRNDIIANISVLFAALGVWITNSQWPDLLVGLGIALLFLFSAFHVYQDATATYAAHDKAHTAEL
ncbi:MAG: cation transporter [Candidatus Marinimicrobia bacterium]|nr:cation transporter [Candidatus Neomarinimicrobiota bacterium]